MPLAWGKNPKSGGLQKQRLSCFHFIAFSFRSVILSHSDARHSICFDELFGSGHTITGHMLVMWGFFLLLMSLLMLDEEVTYSCACCVTARGVVTSNPFYDLTLWTWNYYSCERKNNVKVCPVTSFFTRAIWANWKAFLTYVSCDLLIWMKPGVMITLDSTEALQVQRTHTTHTTHTTHNTNIDGMGKKLHWMCYFSACGKNYHHGALFGKLPRTHSRSPVRTPAHSGFGEILSNLRASGRRYQRNPW